MKMLQRSLEDGLGAPDQRMTVEQLLQFWYDVVLSRQVSPSAAENYRSVTLHHILPTIGSRKVVELTAFDVDRLLQLKTASGLSSSTTARIRFVLAQGIDQGVRWGIVHRNVARLARAPRSVRREGRSLTPAQVQLLLSELTGNRHEALYVLILSTGLRRGEALGLKWEDFDLEAGVMRVKRQLKREGGVLVTSDTKTLSSRRSVNLPDRATSLLQTLREHQNFERELAGSTWIDSGYVFTTPHGAPLDPRNLLKEFKEICRKAGLGDWHIHELRHSAASLMLQQGVKIQVVSEILGHSSIKTTVDVYGHVLDPDRQHAARAMDSLLWGSSE
jgi:integrase